MRAEGNLPWISGANYGTAPLFFPRAPRAVENDLGSLSLTGLILILGRVARSLCYEKLPYCYFKLF